ncbi:MAG: DbpA RNA binding domain-containing protein [Pseudomonadales bacterium]|nr:DbpA RNA binding domain-containing protein [Pseudomonadales bacterium]
MSAVTLLLEDGEGHFHNRDSLGNDFDLRPGDIYWLAAGSGAIHDEYPRANARTHGFQLFVNVSQQDRFETPKSRLVRSEDMPVIETAGYQVKVAMGESNDVRGALTVKGGIEGKEVGKIKIFDLSSFVAIKSSCANKALKVLQEGKVKGRSFRARKLSGH